jgi:hypothetical protein
MCRISVRLLLVIVLSVTLATGFITRSVQAANMDMVITSMNGEMPMHGKCDGCAGSEKTMTPAACVASFCSVAAIAPVVAAFDAASSDTVEPRAETPATGHIFSPNPHPPKSSVLN